MISEHWTGCCVKETAGLGKGRRRHEGVVETIKRPRRGEQMVLRNEVVWVSNLRSHSGNGMEGVEGMSESGDVLGLACLWV